jgi:hypothetical protein
MLVHEDDQYDYYNSDRSSSECESVNQVIRKEVERKLRMRRKTDFSRTAIETFEIAGHPYNPAVPLEDRELATLPVDDLYALAHDLAMPPSQLRKELQRPDDEMDYDQDSDEDGWQHLRGTFLYEKSPAFYSVQLRDLQKQICSRREEWILLELDHLEFSLKNQREFSAMEEFLPYLAEQKKEEKKKVAGLQVKLEKLRGEFRQMVQYQHCWTTWLQEQKTKLIDRFGAQKEALQVRLINLEEPFCQTAKKEIICNFKPV